MRKAHIEIMNAKAATDNAESLKTLTDTLVNISERLDRIEEQLEQALGSHTPATEATQHKGPKK